MLKLIIDTREQKPLEFRPEIFDEIIIDGRPFGDYWIEIDGKEVPFVAERKGLGDLFGTMTHGYERFKKAMVRAKENNFTMVLLVEGSMRDVGKGYEHSQYDGNSMLKKLAMLRVKYDLECHFFNDRREMARWIEEHFSAIARHYKKEKS